MTNEIITTNTNEVMPSQANSDYQLIIRLLYVSGGRISEVAKLTWADVQPNGDSGQVTLFGKGGKTRAVKLSKATWDALIAFRPMIYSNGDPVFVSQKGGSLDETM